MRDSGEVEFVRGGDTWSGGQRNLERGVPTTTGETEDHADGEEDAPYESLDSDVEDQDGV